VAVSPDAIHEHVKTKIEGQETKRLHYAAPEFALEGGVRTSADIYAFGICALEVSLTLCAHSTRTLVKIYIASALIAGYLLLCNFRIVPGSLMIVEGKDIGRQGRMPLLYNAYTLPAHMIYGKTIFRVDFKCLFLSVEVLCFFLFFL